MTSRNRIAVIDIGKTNAKVALVDLGNFREVAVRRTPNRPKSGPPYPHHDHENLKAFILESLAALGRDFAVDAISVTAHGATMALLDGDGDLALPILDYEYEGPDAVADEYDAVRPSFVETGSPRLPGGLNAGAQLFWQMRTFPEAFGRVRAIVTYPQYWSGWLSGVTASEVTSLGAHTDLWNFEARRFSSLVERMGWLDLMAPLRQATERLGLLREDISRKVGLERPVPVYCGIHDSNASLYPHLAARKPPFSVVTTGTWVIAMAIGGPPGELDPDRDTLVNIDFAGNAVSSARFMGGREFERLCPDDRSDPGEVELDRVLESKIMLLPSVQAGTGPFPHSVSRWIGDPERLTVSERRAAVSIYLAMMTATCLSLIGARGPTVVEGPFAGNRIFRRILAAATARPLICAEEGTTGTSFGAALLTDPHALHTLPAEAVTEPATDRRIVAYIAAWQAACME
ncbi:MAG: carbohydrate kinase [Rhizobiaceae bacterium]|nr:MAG: carbohydrate kinase [Rhizobiaceae bacterium]